MVSNTVNPLVDYTAPGLDQVHCALNVPASVLATLPPVATYGAVTASQGWGQAGAWLGNRLQEIAQISLIFAWDNIYILTKKWPSGAILS